MTIQLGLVLLLAVFAQGQDYQIPVLAKDQVFLAERSMENHIINGKDAENGQFPYQTIMWMNKANFCGGSLISPRWVLTAAQCLNSYTEFTVYLGALVITSPSEPGRISMDTRTKIVHENWNLAKFDNDIGLVYLPKDAPLNGQINVLPLPPRSFNDKNFAGQPVLVSGWGKISDSGSAINSKLQYVDLKVISNEECQKTYGKDLITDKIVCTTGPGGKSICNGDGGSPLTIIDEKTNKTTHFAVVSFLSGRGCASGDPTGYDRSYKFLDWIHSKTGITIQD